VTFDTVLTIIGVLLIGFGLYIFLAGKGHREGAPSSKVEGFGIKIDVANPSILLIILGVGLVLVPRFFPDPTPDDDGASGFQQLPQIQAADSLLQAVKGSGVGEEPSAVQSPDEVQQEEGLASEVGSAPPPVTQPEEPAENPVVSVVPSSLEATQRIAASTPNRSTSTAVASAPSRLEAPSPPVATVQEPATPSMEIPRQMAAVASVPKPRAVVAVPRNLPPRGYG